MKKSLSIALLSLLISAGSGAALANNHVSDAQAKQPANQPESTTTEQQWPISQIKSAFQRDPRLKNREIGIEVRGETVRLQGNVNSEDEKYQAEKIAQNIEGIKYVRNHLIINAPNDNQEQKSGSLDTLSSIATDSLITARIKLNLLATNIDVMKVNVDTVDSVVTLRNR